MATLRLLAFGGIFLILSVCEFFWPRKKLSQSKLLRWFTNLSMTTLDLVLVHFLLGTLAFATASWAQKHHLGFFNHFEIPSYFEILLSIILLDFVIYLQHIAFHKIPLCWRFHKVHHTDLDIDVTTGLRFHPLEIIVSLFIKMAAIVILGPSPLAVILFEIILNATSQFNHSNIHIPETMDQTLRMILVTPDMHRVHHSTTPLETNSNFGFSLPWWDHLWKTYRQEPHLPHVSMEIGLPQYRNSEKLNLLNLLRMPFNAEERTRTSTGFPIRS